MTENTKFKCGSLFSGIGGFCLGFESQGFKTLWASDFDAQVEATYKHNFPKTKFLNIDICSLDFNDLEPVDVLHAGFPCQSFSQAGNRSGFNDPRGKLFDVMIDKISSAHWKPKILVFENSPYIQIGENGEWFSHIKRRIKKAGYWFNDQNALKLSTRELAGLPQKRERLFMLATSREFFGFNPFSEINENPQQTKCTDILELDTHHDERYYLSESNRYGKWIKAEGAKLQTGQLLQLRKNVLRPQKVDECPTLTANMGLGGHNVPFLIHSGRLRKMTERECLRMQGFPESFEFPGLPSNAKYRMIGNSVCPLVSNIIAKCVHKELLEQTNYLAEIA